MLLLLTVITLGYFSTCGDACNDGAGIEIVGTTYDCKFLRDFYPADLYVGIYRNRKYHCGQPLTDCCQTCTQILSCKDASNGIDLVGQAYSCSYLLQYLPEDKYIGIYKNRKSLCKQPTTDCCESCEKVLAESTNVTPTTTTTTVSKSDHPTATTLPPVDFKDTCLKNCLWIADGASGKCSYLLDPSRGEYDIRYMLCSQGLARGCRHTCHIVLTERTSNTADDKPVTQTATPVCVDTYMMVEKTSYTCGDLQNSASSIYNNRHALCALDNSACCITCRQVKDEKPSGVVKYTDQNLIDKNDDVIVASATAPTTDNSKSSDIVDGLKPNVNPNGLKSTSDIKKMPGTAAHAQKLNQDSVLVLFQNMKAMADKMERDREAQRNAFSLMITNIISLFEKMKPARK